MNGNFLLNLPPDRRGFIHENDIKRLTELKKYLDDAFSIDLSYRASAQATNSRGKTFNAEKAIDEDLNSYWAADDNTLNASLEINFHNPIEINALLLQEYIPLGQRVKSFTIEAQVDKTFAEAATGVTIGNRRIVKFKTVTTQKLKINIKGKACPLISNIEVYCVPELIEESKTPNN
jgi:alpha-L-fucosidase